MFLVQNNNKKKQKKITTRQLIALWFNYEHCANQDGKKI